MMVNELHETNSKKHRRRASAITLVFFSVVVGLCVFLTAFTIQDPPPGEQFIAVGFADLGSTDEGEGETETEVPSEVVEEVVEEAVAEQVVAEPVVEEQVVTQETSEVVVPQEIIEEVEEPVEETPRESAGANLIANNASSGGGGSQGESEGVGNQGDEDGQIDGAGVVFGDFGSVSLNGGSMISPPRLSEKPLKSGTVRINIVVDASGRVISAKFEAINSLRVDTKLTELARKAAMTTVFTADASTPRRLGFITFKFELE
jgi:periplasmic protein TonB